MARHHTTKPPISWWTNTTKSLIKASLEQRPDIIQHLGHYQRYFLNWCSRYYCGLKPDLDTYIVEFESTIMDKRLENIGVDLYYDLRKYIFSRDKFTCKYCGRIGGRLELDHIIPLSKGGDNSEYNLTTSCYRCNRQKRYKTVDEFLSWKTTHN